MKKTKIALLGTLAGISAITPALTTISCGNSQEVVNKVGDNYDKEYGVDEAVFTKLKNSFPKAVYNKMKGHYSEEEIARAVNNVRSMCASFDKQFRQRNDLSYTTVTSALIEYADRAYGVKLVREFSRKAASFDDLDEAFYGMKDSMDSYMKSSSVISDEEREQILANAQSGYKELKEEMMDRYADPLLGVTKAKSDLFRLFADVNEDIGLLASANRLKDFLMTHKVEYEFKANDDSNKLDTLEKNAWFQEGADLSVDSHILDIFTITREGETEPIKKFDTKIIPGYIVKPILKRINKNARTNEYSLDIDWTCTKESYVLSDPAKAERTTAHYYNGKDGINLKDKTSAYNILKGANDNSFIRYPIYLTKIGEQTALRQEYLNENSEDGCIKFDWDDDSSKNAFEALFSGAKVNKTSNADDYQYIIGNDALAKAGLKIKWDGVLPPDNQDSEKPILTEGRLSDFIAVNSPRYDSRADNSTNITDLMHDFLSNCSAWAYVKPESKEEDGKYSSRNTVYIDYTNTKYATYKDNVVNSVEVLADKACDNLFEVSQESYDYLTTEFNQQMDFLEDYDKNEYQDEYEAVQDDVVLESLMFTLTVLFTAQTTAMCWVPIFAGHLPLYMVLLALSWISLGGQAAILGLLVDKKLKKLEDMKDDCNEVKNSASLKRLIKKVKASQENNFLYRYNDKKELNANDYQKGFDNFKSKAHFFGDNGILQSMEFYQHIGLDPDYQDFLSVLQDHDIRPQDYEEKMEVWDEHGVCTKANWGLLGSTFALDMACLFLLGQCPEMNDWQLCKAMAAESRATGKSIKSLYPVYKQLKKIKDNIAKIGQELKEIGDGILKGMKDVKVEEADKLVRSSMKSTCNTWSWGSEKLKDVGAEAIDLFKALENNDDFATAAGKMVDLVNKDKCGMSVIAKLLATDCDGQITEAGGQILKSIFNNLDTVISATGEIVPTVGLIDSDITKTLYDLVHTGLKSGVITELDKCIKYGALAVRQGLPTEALRSLKEFETILLDSKNWVEDIRNIMGSGSWDLKYVINFVKQSGQYAYNELVKQFVKKAGFILIYH